MNVAAIIVTRGDVDLKPLVESIPWEWPLYVWNNGQGDGDPGLYQRMEGTNLLARRVLGLESYPDLSVYGRYAAIEYTDDDLIYVQDDDCIVSDPQAIVKAYMEQFVIWKEWPNVVVCNMPSEFRHDFYTDHALVGFGAVFHRDAPQRAFDRFRRPAKGFFYRTCDIAFTALTPRVLVDVPKTNLWWAEDETRMWRQPEHVEERTRMLELVRKVRDAD